MNKWLEDNLVCPLDHQKLSLNKNRLSCPQNHHYPYVDDIPVMLIDNIEATHKSHFNETKEITEADYDFDESKVSGLEKGTVDSYVQTMVAGTCGTMYRSVIGNLKRYPIPHLELKTNSREYFLEIGSNWGRWCVSASKNGFIPVGIDPSFRAIQAAKRVARQLEVEAIYLVGDARHLPFREKCFDVAFSYSVFQHFDKKEVTKSLSEIHRVLKKSGRSLVQMLNIFGVRNQYNLLKRRYEKPIEFEVRYWTPWELRNTFEKIIGPTNMSVDGFFSANIRISDIDLPENKFKLLIKISDFLRLISRKLPPLKFFADSLFLESENSNETNF